MEPGAALDKGGGIMITLYSGTPGSGKSLHVAEVIYTNLIRGWRYVLCNFDINYDYFKVKRPFSKKTVNTCKSTCISIENRNLNVKLLVDYARAFFKRDGQGRIVEGQALLVIDECQLFFNSRTWQHEDRSEWIWFFTQHRKFGYDIILVTQFDRLIDRQIRSLLEYEVVHHDVTKFKFMGKLLRFLTRGSVFTANRWWYCMKNKKGGKINSQFFRGKKYYNFYDSYKIFGFFS